MWSYQKSYWSKYWQEHFRCISTFSLEEKKLLESELDIMRQYRGNMKLKIKDLIEAKALSKNLLSPDELHLEKRRFDLLEENHKLLRKFLEIFTKTTSNINIIARDISRGRLENPDSYFLKEDQWKALLEQMEYFKKSSIALFNEIKKRFLWAKNQLLWY